MHPSKTKAFTLIETIIVVAIIWILMLWMTVYFWWWWEKAKVIEAEWCANALNWEIYNRTYSAMTSKIIQSWNVSISPNIYSISLSWTKSTSHCSKSDYDDWDICDTIILSYSWNDSAWIYDTLSSKKICNLSKWIKVAFYRSWCSLDPNETSIVPLDCYGSAGDLDTSLERINISKWLTPLSYLSQNGFSIVDWEKNNAFDGEIIIVLCFDSSCEETKETWKRVIDSRSQTITLHKCKFYKEDDPTKCETREA